MQGLKKELELDEHIVELDVLYKRYGTDINRGLTTAQVRKFKYYIGCF